MVAAWMMDAWANARVDYAWRDASAIKRVYRRSGTTAISTMSQGVGWSGSPIRTLAGPPRAHHVPTCPPRAHHVPTTCPPRATRRGRHKCRHKCRHEYRCLTPHPCSCRWLGSRSCAFQSCTHPHPRKQRRCRHTQSHRHTGSPLSWLQHKR